MNFKLDLLIYSKPHQPIEIRVYSDEIVSTFSCFRYVASPYLLSYPIDWNAVISMATFFCPFHK